MSEAVTAMSSSSSSTKRLLITKMVLENFKSYAGEQEIGPFHKRFSSIVGPNGSGKSNVIDALLFVFGKRAKQLRLNKVSELIHKSSGFPNLEYARVSVHFTEILDNESSDDDYEVVPDSDFVVTRVAYKDNTSKYTVNGKTSSYTAVGQLLRSYGIDLDNNRFLILQGEVEQIAMMKPKGQTPHEEGLLEYLEDIIGSNKFVERIQEQSTVLDGLNEQRTERVNRLKVAERERDNLSGAKAEAEAFLEKENSIRSKKNILYQINEYNAAQNAQDLTTRLNTANEKLTYEKNKLKDNTEKFTSMEKEHATTEKLYNEIDAELQKATAEFGAFERRDVKLQEDKKHTKAQLKKATAAITKESKKEEECIAEAEKLSVQVEAARKSVEDVREKKETEEAVVDEIMQGLQEATAELRGKLEGAQAELAGAERSVAGFQTEKEAVAMAIQLAQSRAATAVKNIASCESKLEALGIEYSQISQTADNAEAEEAAVQAHIEKLRNDVARLTEEETRLQSSVQAAIAAAEEARASYSAQGSSTCSKVVASLLQAAKKGGPLAKAGIRGRLGDLGRIAPEYDVAISTACGLLDYVVVDTAEGGQACIKYLKDSNIGRATFLVLEQMEQFKSRMDRALSTPESLPRLFDLVTPESEDLRPAFYMALRDTIVAPTLDTAVRVAYVGDRAAWRVVTVDGNLIDTSGTMSGGGNSVRSGGMKLSTGAKVGGSKQSGEEISKEQVDELEAAVGRLQAQISDCRKRKVEAECELQSTTAKLKKMAKDAEKAVLKKAHMEEQQKELQSRLAAQRSEAQLTAEEQAEVTAQEARIKDIDAQIERASPQLGQHRAAVATLQRKILDVGGPKLSRAQAKLEILSKQFDEHNKTLTTKEVEESNCRKQAEKSGAAKKKNVAEEEKLREKMAQLEAEEKEMEADAMVIMEAVEAAKAKQEQQAEELKRISGEYEAVKTLMEKIRSVEVDLNEEIDKTKRELRETTAQVKHWQKELETLRQQHAEEANEFSMLSDASMQKSSTEMDTDAGAEAERSSAADALPVLLKEQLEGYSDDRGYHNDLKKEINLLEAERDKLKGNVNMNALMEYFRKDASYKTRLEELEAITAERNVIRKEYENLRRQRLEAFMGGFGAITLKLKEMYQMITLGGDAELELVDSLDPFSEGIVFSVRPPKKSWKNISNLSGGEKTLSSLALVFALHHYKPTPLYVMDEIDAALDFKNVSIVANYIKERTKNAQFVIISLRNNMFELADRLVGIYKTHDATKSVTINPHCFQAPTNTTSVSAGVQQKGDAAAKPREILSDATNVSH
jgi:structural maintenance of chromosome 4